MKKSNFIKSTNKGADRLLRIEGNCVYLNGIEDDTYFGSDSPDDGYPPLQSIQHFVDLGWLGYGDEVDWNGQRFTIVKMGKK